MFSVGYIFWSPVVAKYVDKVGASNLVGLSLGNIGVAFFCFGFIANLESKASILALACSMRLLHGIACATNATTILAIFTNEYPLQREKIYGYSVAMGGLGLITGPLYGSTLFSIFGFQNTFFVYGLLVFLLALVVRVKLNKSAGEEEATTGETSAYLSVNDSAVDLLAARASEKRDSKVLSFNIQSRASITSHVTG